MIFSASDGGRRVGTLDSHLWGEQNSLCRFPVFIFLDLDLKYNVLCTHGL